MKTFSSVYEKARVVSKAQRKKIAIRMKKLAKSSAFQKKKERAMKKLPSGDKIMKLARKAAKKKIIDKFYPKYNEMGIQQRVKTDELISKKYSGSIEKIAKKMIPTIKKKALERIKARKTNEDVRKMPDGKFGVYADKKVKGKRVMTPGGKHAKELKKVYSNEKDANDYMAAIMIAKNRG